MTSRLNPHEKAAWSTLCLYRDIVMRTPRTNQSELRASYATDWPHGSDIIPFFDSKYYDTEYDWSTHNTPLDHYLNAGYKTNDPSPYFDTHYYFAKYSGSLVHPVPLVDMMAHAIKGTATLRDPSPYFISEYYLQQNPDVQLASWHPLAHFIAHGANEWRECHPFFSLLSTKDALTQQAPTLPLSSGRDTFELVITNNLLDIVDPSPLFNNAYYRQTTAGPINRNPFYDYMLRGRNGGDPTGLFITNYYCQQFPQVDFTVVNPWVHYLMFGYKSGATTTSPPFNEATYHRINPDVATSSSPALRHFLLNGVADRRFISTNHRTAYDRLSVSHEPDRYPISTSRSFLFHPFDVQRTLEIDEDDLDSISPSLLSVDFWDTLAIRTSPHWAAKLFSASLIQRHATTSRFKHSALAIYRERINVERTLFKSGIEYTFTQTLQRLAERLGFKADAEFIDKIRSSELDFEQRHIRLHRTLWHMIHARITKSRKCIVLSDYYHDSQYIKECLAAIVPSDHQHLLPRIHVVSSSEVGTSKLSGRLYDTIRAKFKPRTWTHVGDNPLADIKNARERRIDAVEVRWAKPIAEAEPSTSDDNSYFRALEYRFTLSRSLFTRSTAISTRSGESHTLKEARIAGYRLAILPTALIYAAHWRAAEIDAEAVCFLSREGLLLHQLNSTTAHLLPRGIRRKAVAFTCSRRSLFAPAMAAAPDAALDLYRSQYGEASVLDLLRSTVPDSILLQLHAHTGDPTLRLTRIRDIVDGQQLCAALGDVLFGILQEYCHSQLALLREFALPGGALEHNNVVLCDIGWRGTMQHMLHLIFPEKTFSGMYAGLFLNPSQADDMELFTLSGSRSALIFDRRIGDPFSHVDPPAAIERPLTPLVGTCIGYARDTQGNVTPVLQDVDTGLERSTSIVALQAALMECAEATLSFLISEGIDPRFLKSMYAGLLESYYRNPGSGVADCWFEAEHDDTFGAGTHPYQKVLPDIRTCGVNNWSYELSVAEAKSRWPHGFRAWRRAQWFSSLFTS